MAATTPLTRSVGRAGASGASAECCFPCRRGPTSNKMYELADRFAEGADGMWDRTIVSCGNKSDSCELSCVYMTESTKNCSA